MHRRNFLSSLGIGGVASAAPWRTPSPRLEEGEVRTGLPKIGAAPDIRWQKLPSSVFFTQATCEGLPLVFRGRSGLLTATWSVEGTSGSSPRLGLKDETARFAGCTGMLQHRLLRAGRCGTEDVLEAEITLRNESGKAQILVLEFATSARPFAYDDQVLVHLPLAATGLEQPGSPICPGPWATNNVVEGQLKECDQPTIDMEEDGNAPVGHYLEARESDPSTLISKAPLLIPLVDLHNEKVNCRLALFCSPLRPWRIDSSSCRTRVRLGAGVELVEKCYLFIHRGGPEEAWRAFHGLAHHPDQPRITWPNEVVVHYTEYLSPGKQDGKRGMGFWEDVREFSIFHVGLTVTEGYYTVFGDYIEPNRKSWTSMNADAWGPVEMSFDEIHRRTRAARDAGARVSIYMAQCVLDSSSPSAKELQESRLIDKDGRPVMHPWVGAENVGAIWLMSMASPLWRRHFLQQVRWIMEILRPDAIEIDESFWGLGYDYRSGSPEGLSQYMIPFQRELYQLVRSFGKDKALFVSDCCWSSFVLWADGDVSDHENIWREEYRKTPVRYLAALADRRWLPCLWRPAEWWDYQMDLARKCGAAVAVSNGQIEYAGLTGQPSAVRAKMLAGIEELRRQWAGRG